MCIEVLLLKTLWKFIYKILHNVFNSSGILLHCSIKFGLQFYLIAPEKHETVVQGNEMKHCFLCWKNFIRVSSATKMPQIEF